MTIKTHQVPASLADAGPLQTLIAAQFAWQQVFWQVALAPWGNAVLSRPHGALPSGHAPEHGDHDQLVIPSACAASGEPALFA